MWDVVDAIEEVSLMEDQARGAQKAEDDGGGLAKADRAGG